MNQKQHFAMTLVEKAAENAEIEIPEAWLKTEIDRMLMNSNNVYKCKV